MLKKLIIRNFKAIVDMTIEFTPLTVLIGENGCGKTTILQALDFLRSAASRDIPEYLREKDWDFHNLKSLCSGLVDKPIEFISEWNFPVNGKPQTIQWEFSVDVIASDNGNQNGKYIIKEKIIRQADGSMILVYPDSLGQMNIQSSALKYAAGTSWNTDEMDKLSFFLSQSVNFELLSPDRLRSGKKMPFSKCIGAGGVTSAYFIHKLERPEKNLLNTIVSDLIDTKVEIQTFDQGSRVELILVTKKAGETMYIESEHISDGILRIIAYAAITMDTINKSANANNVYAAEPKKAYIDDITTLQNGFVLLDEIEDGINPYLSEKILLLLRSHAKKEEKQVILTTHSPVMLNDFEPEEIVFLWKDKRGSVHSRKFFDTEEMRELLEALNPGEVWINLQKDEILEKLSCTNEGTK
ncbi:MAG: AAA family ATPase [Treponema sp.]|nr:AAA family ATPase [Treponema sp.]